MSDAASRAERATALEERRRRLEEMRARRERREPAVAAASANLDEYIDGLLQQQPGADVAATAAAASESAAAASTTAATATTASAAATSPTAPASQPSPATATTTTTAPPPASPAPPVKKVETFTISTQTEESDFPEVAPAAADPSEHEFSERSMDNSNGAQPAVVVEDDGNDNDNSNIDSLKISDPKLLSSEEVEKEVTSKPFSSFINSASKKVERVLGAPLLSDLLVDYYGSDDAAASSNNNNNDSRDAAHENFVTSQQVYECPPWTAGREITDLHWSPLHRELVLATYHQPQSSSSSTSSSADATVPAVSAAASLTPRHQELASDGLALVWSLTMPHRPEHILTCGSPVTAGQFHPHESPLILGGCQNGQVVVWDVRAGKLPVQKSGNSSGGSSGSASNSSSGHVQSICRMQVTEGGSALVTASTDGKVSFWSLGDLREPADSIQVSDCVSCFRVAPESETLVLGDEYGGLYACPMTNSSSSNNKAAGSSGSAPGGASTPAAAAPRASRKQVRPLDKGSSGSIGEDAAADKDGGHYGLITSVSTKVLKKGAAARSAGQHKGFLRGSGGLVASSGVDWTVKIWAPAYVETKPLLSLVSHSYDYMSDVQWSPTHPSLLATASSNGTVGLWNFAQSMDEPLVEGIPMMDTTTSSSSANNNAATDPPAGLNRLEWSGDGRRLGVASADRLHILHLAEDVVKPQGDEDTKMMNDFMARGLIERT